MSRKHKHVWSAWAIVQGREQMVNPRDYDTQERVCTDESCQFRERVPLGKHSHSYC